MKTNKILLTMAVCVIVLCCNQGRLFGDNAGSDPAECDITITVDSIVEWEGPNPQGTAETMPAINLANITDQTTAPEGTSTLTLFINCNVSIAADNTTASQLTHQRGDVTGLEDTLVTKYQLATDGDGDPASGAAQADIDSAFADDWIDYDDFLTPTALAITHFNTDGAVEVTLSVQATNDAHNVADTGTYEATQTLTATWVSDN